MTLSEEIMIPIAMKQSVTILGYPIKLISNYNIFTFSLSNGFSDGGLNTNGR